MNIFSILSNLYTNKQSDWISNIEDTDIQPFVIQKWLSMNDRIRVQTRWLDKYVFVLTPKMYLSLAWSIIPKSEKAPFVKYIKKKDESVEYDFIFNRIRKHMELSDNDFIAIKDRLFIHMKNNLAKWFAYYGIEKKYWKKYSLNFDLIKEYGTQVVKKPKGLSQWGF